MTNAVKHINVLIDLTWVFDLTLLNSCSLMREN